MGTGECGQGLEIVDRVARVEAKAGGPGADQYRNWCGWLNRAPGGASLLAMDQRTPRGVRIPAESLSTIASMLATTRVMRTYATGCSSSRPTPRRRDMHGQRFHAAPVSGLLSFSR